MSDVTDWQYWKTEGLGAYFVKLDVLAPSFLIAMIFGWIFSKIFPPSQPSGSQSTARQS